MNLRQTIIASIVLWAFAGCATQYRHDLKFNPSEPLRVAVLPFLRIDAAGKPVTDAGSHFVDGVPLLSEGLSETPEEFVRKIVQREISTTALDLVTPLLVDVELPHHGYAHNDGTVDFEKLYAARPDAVCRDMLDCDAVLYGWVTKWERNYYGLQTVNRVGIKLKLVSVRDGKTLFASEAEDYESRGISKGPTGYSSLVLEPVKGLDSELISDLTRNIARKMLEPLSVKNRPQFLDTAPPAIYASSHDVDDGELGKAKKLVVVAYGTPGAIATFSIGSVVENIPMLEKAEGHYYGEFYPLQGDSFSAQPVIVKIADGSGRSSEQHVPNVPISLK